MRVDLVAGGRCAVLLVLAACAAGITVHDESAPDTNLTSLRAFVWDGGQVVRKVVAGVDTGTRLEALVDRALLEALAERGYRRSPEQADFRVSYSVIVEQKVTATELPEFESPRLGDRGGFSRSETHEFVYDEGTLSIELRDPDSRELLWRGWAQAEVTLDASAEEREARAREAIRRLLERLPRSTP